MGFFQPTLAFCILHSCEGRTSRPGTQEKVYKRINEKSIELLLNPNPRATILHYKNIQKWGTGMHRAPGNDEASTLMRPLWESTHPNFSGILPAQFRHLTDIWQIVANPTPDISNSWHDRPNKTWKNIWRLPQMGVPQYIAGWFNYWKI